MTNHLIDRLSRVLAAGRSRRALLPLLASLLTLTRLASLPVVAKKKRKKKRKKPFCLDGRTIKASRKKKKKLRRRGATPGRCPTGCTPRCPGSACGGDDGCGGACGCGPGALCHSGVCQPCTVTCQGNAAACGTALQTALGGGGTVYVCPGRYQGSFTLGSNVVLIGAGEGDDPSRDTILDAQGGGRVLKVNSAVTAALHGLRITGGAQPDDYGGGILTHGDLTMTACTVTQNQARYGGGIQHYEATGGLKLTGCTITRNTCEVSGGGLNRDVVANHPVTLTNCTVSENLAGTNGGGIEAYRGPIGIFGSTISGNRATGRGGGVYLNSHLPLPIVTFDDKSRVIGNTADIAGGGIYRDDGTVALNGATVNGNSPTNCDGAGGFTC